jgi:MFS family permease
LNRRPRGRYVALLRRNPELRRLYFSRLVSFGGDWFLLVPMLGLVNELSGSAVLTAAVLAANTLPAFLASPIGGVLADRWDRRRIMIWSNVAAGVAATGMLLVDHPAILRAGISVPLALVGLGILAALSALISPASSAAIPAVVAREDLADATFLIESTWGTMAAVGSAAGGLVSTLAGRDAAIAIDAISFLGAALLVSRIRAPLRMAVDAGHGLPTTLRAAGKYVLANPPIVALLTSKAGFAVFGAGAVALLPVLALDVFGEGDDGIGWLLGARGLGVLLGPFLIRRLVGGTDRRVLGAIGFAMALWGLGYLGTAAAPTLGVAAMAVFVGHMGAGSQWSFSSYGLQRYAADEVKGRVFGLDFAAVTATATASQLIFGWLAEDIPVRVIIGSIAAVAVLFGLAWWRATRKYWT